MSTKQTLSAEEAAFARDIVVATTVHAINAINDAIGNALAEHLKGPKAADEAWRNKAISIASLAAVETSATMAVGFAKAASFAKKTAEGRGQDQASPSTPEGKAFAEAMGESKYVGDQVFTIGGKPIIVQFHNGATCSCGNKSAVAVNLPAGYISATSVAEVDAVIAELVKARDAAFGK